MSLWSSPHTAAANMSDDTLRQTVSAYYLAYFGNDIPFSSQYLQLKFTILPAVTSLLSGIAERYLRYSHSSLICFLFVSEYQTISFSN